MTYEVIFATDLVPHCDTREQILKRCECEFVSGVVGGWLRTLVTHSVAGVIQVAIFAELPCGGKHIQWVIDPWAGR